jgi:hypothetical protein
VCRYPIDGYIKENHKGINIISFKRNATVPFSALG